MVITHVGMAVQENVGFFPCGGSGGHEDVVFDMLCVTVGHEESEAFGGDDPAGRQLAVVSPFIAVASDCMGGDVGVFCLQIIEIAPAIAEMEHHIYAAMGEMILHCFLHEGGVTVCIGENKNFHGKAPLGKMVLSVRRGTAYTEKETKSCGGYGNMKLEKKMIDQMLALPDDKLWQMFQLLARGSGLKIGDRVPEGAGMRKLRAVLEAVTDADIGRVIELIELYKETK